ncbi:conjugal transfer protein TraG N-terminal domain-containing protein [Vibrio sp. ZSDE26]|uniref:Conjugal transfer protein TraG N-terminal domain-containing protein n=1 Tax=Vibrio amylolyticus TaxID=2847292 RepID=A0A9X1XIF7_9VIBR|nr:conjugal transfer protein TraG N-terminal domain-containing protein [Vibrio amylolyticus]MCK6263817.1 conjugal transfer protein TraG N-terminal domain-containing protein [Vibrio amylolyticus]
MTLEYYVYTQGATLQRALNAIAAFFQSASFASMTSIALMIGAIMTMALFFTTRNTKHIFVWAIVFTLVPSMLLQQTARVQIIDKTEPSGVYSVDNVPYLVAVPTWFFSTMMVGVTEAVETIFMTTDDKRYGRTGMMFGSELYQLSRQADLRDIEVRRTWNDFFKNCIIGDVEINRKYTWQALLSAPDIFGFLDGQSMSPLRGVMINGMDQDFKTCREIYPDLKSQFGVASADELDLMGTYLHGAKAATYAPHVRNALQNSYQDFIGISNNAVDVLRQNMTINAMRRSIHMLNPNASAMTYAYTSNKMQQTSMWATLGMQAREFIPMMHTMLFFLFSCLSFMIAAAALIPALTKMVLVNYIKTFAYLAAWPPLFAILNVLMVWPLEVTSSATADPMNGLSLSNANALDELHTRFGYMAGFLMMTIPVLAGKVLQGGVAAAQAMNYQLAGMINSTNARVSAASSTGNMDFGNLQMQNHSFNNTSANKLDDNMLVKAGMATIQQKDGASIITLINDGGRKLYNAQDAESKPIWQAQTSTMLQNSVSDQYTSALTAQKQNMNTFTDNYSNSMQQSDRWNDNWSRSLSYGDSHSASTEGQISQSYTTMESAIDTISQTMGWTHDQARAYAISANAGVSIGTPGQSVLGGGASAGVQWSTDQREAYSNMSAEQKQALEQATQQYSEGSTSMERAGRTMDTKDNRSAVEQYAHDFALNHQRLQSSAASVSESNAEVDSLQNIQSRLDTNSVNFSASAVTGFQTYLESEFDDKREITRLMNATKPEDLRDVRREFNDYTRTESFQNAFGVSTSSSDLEGLAAMYQPRNLGNMPTSSAEQKAGIKSGSERAKGKIEEVTIDMINYPGIDELYDNDVYRNVKGNVLVAGGHMQNEAEQPVTPTTDPNSDVAKTVQDQLITPPKMDTDRPPHTGYQLYDSNSKK